MISPEVLRRYPFFGSFNESELVNLATIAEELQLEKRQVLFEQGKKADALYFLLSGGIDLSYTITEKKEVPVSDINVGEPFGISTIIEPHILTSTARSSGESRVLRFNKEDLQRLMTDDPQLELLLLRQLAKTAIQRLNAVRTQLASNLA
jgi:CRP/FNR family cyclic AMP-dependent transcriptional regulator